MDVQYCDIRPYAIRDLKRIKDISSRCFKEPVWDDTDFNRFLSKVERPNGKEKYSAYVAEWREVVIGYIFVVEWKWHFEIASMAVAPEFQGRGVGTKMLDYVKDNKLEPYGKEQLLLYAKTDEEKACRFAVSRGFFHEGTIDSDAKFVFNLPELPLDLSKVPVREGGLLVCDT